MVKACPKCEYKGGVPIACLHITCPKCSHGWCWLCQGDWSKHGSNTGGYYQCNAYKPKLNEKQKSVQKLKFYLNRKDTHNNMLKKQLEHSEMSLKKMNEILESVTNNESGDFFEYALRSICESRRAIVWTYPYGYFLIHKPKRRFYTIFQ